MTVKPKNLTATDLVSPISHQILSSKYIISRSFDCFGIVVVVIDIFISATMGIFSGSSPFDQDVGKNGHNTFDDSSALFCYLQLYVFFFYIDKATDEKNMGDNWETILDVCDKVKAITTGPKDCLRAILRRLNNPNPHVAKQAVIVMST